LPELLREFRLIADRLKTGRVRTKSLHDVRVRIVRDVARDGFAPECRYPPIEPGLRQRLFRQQRYGKRPGGAADK
jgi:hypothetical protein